MEKQLTFFDLTKSDAFKSRKVHGGTLTKGKRKLARPISVKKWMHLTLKASRAVGVHSLWHARRREEITELIKSVARKNGVAVGNGVNMGNHLHLQIKATSRQGFQRFLRTITGLIARLCTGAKKGKAFGKFWDELAYSRILTSSKEVLGLKGYFEANKVERGKGYQAREKYLKCWNAWIKSLRPKAKGSKIHPDF